MRKKIPPVHFFLLVGGLLTWSIPAAWARDLPLFESLGKVEAASIHATDASVSNVTLGRQSALRIATRHQADWPGIVLPAPAGHWDLAPYGQVVLTVKNSGSNAVTVCCRVDNAGADGYNHCRNGEVALSPGQAGQLFVELRRTSEDDLGGKLFGMRGYPAKLGGSNTIDPANVTQILVFVSKPAQDHVFEVSSIAATGHYTPPTAWTSDATPFFPFIDTFGQYLHKSWPGKTKSVADLAAKRNAEAAEMAKAPQPLDWDEYGGWRFGPKLEATGFFHTGRARGKWWLVDPNGCLFFSHGIDCIGLGDRTPITGRENWFQNPPWKLPEFAQYLSRNFALMGHYAGQSPESFSFVDANLARKYGSDWSTIYPRLVQQRLRSWGFNTIGNWSDHNIMDLRLTPYTDTIHSLDARMIEGSKGYWGKFPDPFDPSLAAGLRRTMQWAQGKSAGDPWCMGFFSDNEMSWGDDTSIALATLNSGPDQPAKKVFVADLQARYKTIGNLNKVWGTTYPSWDAVLQSRSAPDPIKARHDLTAFYSKAAQEYFRTAREAVKSVAPNQLYLGCRFAWVNALAAAAAAKYCDVVSYNVYKRGVASFKFNGGRDVPLLVGEFHFGALDRGLFHTGLVDLPDQAARARAYRDFVESALHHPQFVGCHWFQYRDEPVTGRVLDEENYQIGMVDVADTPYAETIAAARAVGYHLYQ